MHAGFHLYPPHMTGQTPPPAAPFERVEHPCAPSQSIECPIRSPSPTAALSLSPPPKPKRSCSRPVMAMSHSSEWDMIGTGALALNGSGAATLRQCNAVQSFCGVGGYWALCLPLAGVSGDPTHDRPWGSPRTRCCTGRSPWFDGRDTRCNRGASVPLATRQHSLSGSRIATQHGVRRSSCSGSHFGGGGGRGINQNAPPPSLSVSATTPPPPPPA